MRDFFNWKQFSDHKTRFLDSCRFLGPLTFCSKYCMASVSYLGVLSRISHWLFGFGKYLGLGLKNTLSTE